MLMTASRTAFSSRFLSRTSARRSNLTPIFKNPRFLSFPHRLSSSSPYPLYYELIRYRPAKPSPAPRHRQEPQPDPALPHSASHEEDEASEISEPMDRSKRKYYRKRRKRMYGESDSESDADSGRRSHADEFVELKPEVVDFPRLHAREQEIYFYDAFAFPWEKEKHYRMVYQLEKKYFPDQCLDKAFVDPEEDPLPAVAEVNKGRNLRKKFEAQEERDEKGLVFFEEEKGRAGAHLPLAADVSEKKVEDFFKCLKKAPNASGGKAVSSTQEDGGEPYLASRRTDLPPRWDGPFGTVVLVDKPKGSCQLVACLNSQFWEDRP